MQNQEGSELHLEFLDGIEIKIGLDSGRPAAKMKVAGSLGSSEYSGAWVNPGELVRISAVRNYSNKAALRSGKRLAELHAFLDSSNRLNWIATYSGRHSSGAAMTVIASNGEQTLCEELTVTPANGFQVRSDLKLVSSEIQVDDNTLVMSRLGL